MLIPLVQQREIEMADRELIAAILAAGMLPTLPIPLSRAQGRGGPMSEAEEVEGEAVQRAVGHAVDLFRSVLEGLGVDPFTGHLGT